MFHRTLQKLVVGLGIFVLLTTAAFAGGKQEDKGKQDTPASTTQQKSEQSTDQNATQSTDSSATGDVVATVNGTEISRAEFEDAVARTQRQYESQSGQLDSSKLNDLKKSVLDSLISRELLYQAAQKSDITVDSAKVDDQIGSLKGRFQSDEQYQAALKNAGITEEDLRQDVKKSLVIQELLAQKVTPNVTVGEEEAKKFYEDNPDLFTTPERVHARHILISTQDLKTDQEKADAKARAEEIRKDLENGADFEKLAKEKSEGPSASKGGDLGTFSKGDMVPAFEDAAFALKPGEISKVIETQFGYHIIQVLEKFPKAVQPFADVQDQINNYLSQQKQSDETDAYLKKLKENANIETMVNFG